MECRAHLAIEAEFNRRAADNDLARYRRRGPVSTTRRLIDALVTAGATARYYWTSAAAGARSHMRCSARARVGHRR